MRQNLITSLCMQALQPLFWIGFRRGWSISTGSPSSRLTGQQVFSWVRMTRRTPSLRIILSWLHIYLRAVLVV